MEIKGRARIDRRTKALIPRLKPGEIAVIDHCDIDEVAAEGLIKARARAVINAASSMSGRYPNEGPLRLLEASIPIIDEAGEALFDRLSEGVAIEVHDGRIFVDGEAVGEGRSLEARELEERIESARRRLPVAAFVENTLRYAELEKDFIIEPFPVPPLRTDLERRHVLVVVRGRGYREDLAAIRSYIDELNPVLVGVDGGADALREHNYQPDLIVGDMDSVSDETLASGAELVVHAYADGRAPGEARVRRLGLTAHVLPAPGTSEDIAMLMAYEAGAALIVAVGTHSSLVDFLEKGRSGMASTFLTRLKVGAILVDAKGVNRLYRTRTRGRNLLQIALAALVPAVLVAALSPSLRQWVRLLIVKLRLILGL
ncbi:MAG TPA: putative cytokinetic ring protein SteA [Limnochordia bacterium]|nr:putative cytokinetic ring protein SteA [Limnochordia bacterium]